MLKSMPPETLAETMKASGLNVTPDQARSMVDKLDSVSGAWHVGVWEREGVRSVLWEAGYKGACTVGVCVR